MSNIFHASRSSFAIYPAQHIASSCSVNASSPCHSNLGWPVLGPLVDHVEVQACSAHEHCHELAAHTNLECPPRHLDVLTDCNGACSKPAIPM